MAKLQDELKKHVIGLSILTTGAFGAASKAVAQTSLDERPAATAGDTLEQENKPVKSQREYWIEQGKEIGRVELASELLEKNVKQITSKLTDATPQLQKEWKEEILPVVSRNIASAKRGLKRDEPDTQALSELLDTSMLLVAKWNEKLLSQQVASINGGAGLPAKQGGPEILPGLSANGYSLGLYNPIALDMYLQVRPEAHQLLGGIKQLMGNSIEKLAAGYDPSKPVGENIRDAGMREARQTNEFSKGYRAGYAAAEKTAFENGYIKGKREAAKQRDEATNDR